MPFGRFGSFPFRLGGGEPLSRKLYRDLNGAIGTAYDTSSSSTVTAETAAEARAIAAAWRANERAANQLDSDRMTDFVSRWESILRLTPSSSDTLTTRRARVKAKRSALGSPDRSAINTVCLSALGNFFVQTEYVPLELALQRWPGNGFPDDNYSTTSHILVRVHHPAGTYDGPFLAACNGLVAILRDFIADWATVDWGILNSAGSNGFLLDDPHNLDMETFDS